MARAFFQPSTLALAPVQSYCLLQALHSPTQDFEDVVFEDTADRNGAHTILTRDTADCASTPLPAIIPTDYLNTP